MMPLIDVTTWLDYREIIMKQNDTELLQHIRNGGEDCFDLAWCHNVRQGNGMQDWQDRPTKTLRYDESSPKFQYDKASTYNFSGDAAELYSVAELMGGFYNRSCVVLYQLPIIHGNGKALVKDRKYKRAGEQVRLYLRNKFRIVWAVRNAYETFSA